MPAANESLAHAHDACAIAYFELLAAFRRACEDAIALRRAAGQAVQADADAATLRGDLTRYCAAWARAAEGRAQAPSQPTRDALLAERERLWALDPAVLSHEPHRAVLIQLLLTHALGWAAGLHHQPPSAVFADAWAALRDQVLDRPAGDAPV